MDDTVMTVILGIAGGFVASMPISYLAYRLAAKQHGEATDLMNQINEALMAMLQNPRRQSCTFEKISQALPGIPADHIRQALIIAGGVSFLDEEGRENWILVSRHDEAPPQHPARGWRPRTSSAPGGDFVE